MACKSGFIPILPRERVGPWSDRIHRDMTQCAKTWIQAGYGHIRLRKHKKTHYFRSKASLKMNF